MCQDSETWVVPVIKRLYLVSAIKAAWEELVAEHLTEKKRPFKTGRVVDGYSRF
jgi:hypothetical protein